MSTYEVKATRSFWPPFLTEFGQHQFHHKPYLRVSNTHCSKYFISFIEFICILKMSIPKCEICESDYSSEDGNHTPSNLSEFFGLKVEYGNLRLSYFRPKIAQNYRIFYWKKSKNTNFGTPFFNSYQNEFQNAPTQFARVVLQNWQNLAELYAHFVVSQLKCWGTTLEACTKTLRWFK